VRGDFDLLQSCFVGEGQVTPRSPCPRSSIIV
jgi:hypothetical protein